MLRFFLPAAVAQADYIKAYLTFATQMLLITMLFMGIDLSQFGIFQQSFLISLTVTAIVISIVKGQVENHMAFRETFKDGAPLWLIVLHPACTSPFCHVIVTSPYITSRRTVSHHIISYCIISYCMCIVSRMWREFID